MRMSELAKFSENLYSSNFCSAYCSVECRSISRERFLRKSDGPSIFGTRSRRCPVDKPSSYPLTIKDRCTWGQRKNSEIKEALPRPPQNKATFICLCASWSLVSAPREAFLEGSFEA